MISLGSPKKILRSPKKIGGSQRKSGVSNKFIWGLIWESATKIWGLNLKLGVSNDKFGLSNETVVMVGFYKAEALLLMLGFCKAEALLLMLSFYKAETEHYTPWCWFQGREISLTVPCLSYISCIYEVEGRLIYSTTNKKVGNLKLIKTNFAERAWSQRRHRGR